MSPPKRKAGSSQDGQKLYEQWQSSQSEDIEVLEQKPKGRGRRGTGKTPPRGGARNKRLQQQQQQQQQLVLVTRMDDASTASTSSATSTPAWNRTPVTIPLPGFSTTFAQSSTMPGPTITPSSSGLGQVNSTRNFGVGTIGSSATANGLGFMRPLPSVAMTRAASTPTTTIPPAASNNIELTTIHREFFTNASGLMSGSQTTSSYSTYSPQPPSLPPLPQIPVSNPQTQFLESFNSTVRTSSVVSGQQGALTEVGSCGDGNNTTNCTTFKVKLGNSQNEQDASSRAAVMYGKLQNPHVMKRLMEINRELKYRLAISEKRHVEMCESLAQLEKRNTDKDQVISKLNNEIALKDEQISDLRFPSPQSVELLCICPDCNRKW